MSKQTAEIEIKLSNGAQAGKSINELTAESVKLARELKKMDTNSQEFVDKTKEYKEVAGRLRGIKKEAFDTSKAQSFLNSSLGDMVPFNSQIGKFIGTYNNVGGAIKGATLAQKAMNVAIAMSGIGALLILFGSLISYLTSTQAGMDKVTSVTRPLLAIFERLKGLVQELGENVFKGLGQILNGDIKDGLATLGGGVKDAVTGVTGAIKEGAAAGTELDKLTKAIEIRKNEMIVSQARLNREIAEQNELARDSTKSENERQEAAQKAIALLDQRTQAENSLLDMQIEKLKIEQSLNDTDRAGNAEMNTLIAQREENEARAAKERIRMNNIANKDISEGGKALTASHKTEVDTRIKQEEQYAKMVINADKTLQDLRIGMMTDETARKIEQITIAATREMEAFEGTEAQKTEFLLLKEQERDAAITALRDENAKKAFDKSLENLDLENEIRTEKVNELFFSNLITEEEQQDMLYNIQVAAVERRLALLLSAGETESAEYQKLYTDLAKLHYDYEEKKYQDSERFINAKKALERESLNAAGEVFNGFAALLASDEEAKRKNFGVIRGLKLAETKISFINELAGIWETANKNPLNIIFPGSGNAIAAIKTVAATARFGAGVQSIMGAKFKDGGPVFGPSHQGGGIPFGVKNSSVRHEMEGNEIIMTKGVYKDPVLRAMASDLNVMGGGRSFALGGPVVDRPMVRSVGDVSTAARQATGQNQNGTSPDMAQTNSYLAQIASNTAKSANNPVPISIQKIREGLNTISTVENEARN